MRISIQNPEFRPYVVRNPKGSVMLGYLRGDLTFHDSDGSSCAIELKGALRVKLNVAGKLSIGTPSAPWEGKEGTKSEGKSGYTSAYRFDDATYAALLTVVRAIPECAAAIKGAKSAKSAPAANVEADTLAGIAADPSVVAQLIAALTRTLASDESASDDSSDESDESVSIPIG